MSERSVSVWTPENAHVGVEEMESHINAIVGGMEALAARIDEVSPGTGASNILAQYKVGNPGRSSGPGSTPHAGPKVAVKE